MNAERIVVIGAGAAGLWAAARMAERGRDVLLLEKTQRTGTKVLASGGTRCNLTTTLGPDDAARLFGRSGERFLRRAFRNLPPKKVREQFAQLGVPTVEAQLEKVFPESQKARDVRDALERWARGAGVRVELSAPVSGIERRDDAWRVACEDGRGFDASTLVLATGGKSYARTGTTGEGYGWLADLGLPIVPTVPALVPLVSSELWVRELAGIALQEVHVRLEDADRRVVGRRQRPVVFSHRGISGPGAMDLSASVHDGMSLVLDLVPDVSREELQTRLRTAAGEPGKSRLTHLLGTVGGERLPRRLLQAVFAQAGLERADLRPNELKKADRHALIETLKGLRVPVSGTEGFDKAEVTAGGLDLSVVDPGSMRVRGHDGLIVIGELLDRAGPIGGLNFQAAFAEAEMAARIPA
jgi:predicted Rossmann fold flavoprotein